MCLWDPALIDEVGSGRLQIGAVLSRAFDGNMKINTLVHVRVGCAMRTPSHSISSQDGLHVWTQRTALVPLRDCTFDLLRAVILARSLSLPPRVRSRCLCRAHAALTARPQVSSPYTTLLSAGVCEGSLEVFATDAAERLKLLGLSS